MIECRRCSKDIRDSPASMVNLTSAGELEVGENTITFKVCFKCILDIKNYVLGNDIQIAEAIDAAQDEYEFNRLMDCSGIDEIGKFPPGQKHAGVSWPLKKNDN